MTGKRRSLPQRIEPVALILLFGAGLLLPLADRVFHLDPSPDLTEKRDLAPRPVFERRWSIFRDYPKAFEDYFRDHLGFRKSLIRWHNWIHVKWLHLSPVIWVTVGEDGWLYLGTRAIEYHRGVDRLAPETLARMCRILEERRRWLADRGISFACVVAPDKESIYPEYLPARLSRVTDRTSLDDFIDYLHAYSTVDLVDLREPVRNGKSGPYRLYQKTGTHWNRWGAYLGYRALLEHLSTRLPGVVPVPDTDLTFVRKRVPGYDLAELMALKDVLMEDDLRVEIRNPKSRQQDKSLPADNLSQRAFSTERDGIGLPRVVIFRDSFAGNMIPFLSESFRRIVYVQDMALDEELLERERPDLAILMMGERAIMERWPANAPTLSHTFLEETFQGSGDVRFALHAPSERKQLALVGRVSVKPAGDRVQVEFGDSQSAIGVPVSLTTSPSLLIARLDLESTQDTTLGVGYVIRKKGKWHGESFFTSWLKRLLRLSAEDFGYQQIEKSLDVPVAKGHRSLYVPIEAQGLAGPLRLHLRPDKGPYWVYDLEIRNVPYPHETGRPNDTLKSEWGWNKTGTGARAAGQPARGGPDRPAAAGSRPFITFLCTHR